MTTSLQAKTNNELQALSTTDKELNIIWEGLLGETREIFEMLREYSFPEYPKDELIEMCDDLSERFLIVSQTLKQQVEINTAKEVLIDRLIK